MTDFKAVDAAIAKRMDQNLEELSRLCAQPSISAQGLGMQECAELVMEILRQRGFKTELMPTKGFPVVYAELPGRSDRTLLLYNHYDVQPPEPLELWDSPPFEPTIRDGKMYARGVSDDKGHIICRLAAIDALLEVDGELPCNIKFVIEGEEETSSPNLHAFVAENVELLKADGCLWEFGGVNHEGVPVLYAGLRGICYLQLSVETASRDAHSGLAGSIFPNAAWRLVWALRSIKGSDEYIRVSGFYDGVRPPTERDLEYLAKLPESSHDLKKTYGVRRFIKGLEDGIELRKEAIFSPTCTICGLTAGYQGPGSKTVLPAKASAKVDFRLIPDQDPEEVAELVRAHLDDEGFDDVQIEYLGGERPARTDPDDPFLQMVASSAEEIYGTPMLVTPMSGGSGPNDPFVRLLKVPVATAGIGYPDSRAHAPNENIIIDLLEKGIRHTARIMSLMEAS
ncbi:MAG TPA: M20/M25/M40 family metallo-hydrolase [Anaerolineae bacterium]|nr:M20/M25/M40 family metallo-hydrolase [Anaerolineae bacterium]